MIRNYRETDKTKCLEVFQSNCPKFFDRSEYAMFEKWLDHQAGNSGYESPTYKNAEMDAYYVIDHPDHGIIGCGGFYILKDAKEARLAWGMIHSAFHKMGYGTELYLHRKKVVDEEWVGYQLTLGTSQHTFPFYQKMGMKVTANFKSGYGKDLDRYDMVQ